MIARACWFLDRLPRETWTIELDLRPRREVAGGPNMNVKAEFLFDFGSPNAYLAHRALPGIESRTGVRFVYVPALLGGIFKATGNVSQRCRFRASRTRAPIRDSRCSASLLATESGPIGRTRTSR